MISDDDNQPATKGDVKSVRREVEGIDERLINVESDVKDLKAGQARIERAANSILETVTTMGVSSSWSSQAHSGHSDTILHGVASACAI